jgi:hypothetical protein
MTQRCTDGAFTGGRPDTVYFVTWRLKRKESARRPALRNISVTAILPKNWLSYLIVSPKEGDKRE